MSKSNHKHDYKLTQFKVNELLIYTKRHFVSIIKECSICGKIKREGGIWTKEQIDEY